MSRPMLASEWKVSYAAAMLESDPKQLRYSIHVATIAMRARLKELGAVSPPTMEAAELHLALSYVRRVAACLRGNRRRGVGHNQARL